MYLMLFESDFILGFKLNTIRKFQVMVSLTRKEISSITSFLNHKKYGYVVTPVGGVMRKGLA